MSFSITDLYRYPVKGLAGVRLDSVGLSVEEGFPFDRRWAMTHAASNVDPATKAWAQCSEFLRLARDEKLGQLGTDFDAETCTITLLRKGRQVSRGRLDEPTGRTLVESFLAGFLPSGPRGKPRIVEAPRDSAFTDVEGANISIINLASVRDIERVSRTPVDPRRFRGNIYIDGGPAWREFEWLGGTIKIGDVALKVLERIDRCAATNVNPANGAVDMNIPMTLRKGFGHIDCGLRCRVLMGGEIAKGDALSLA